MARRQKGECEWEGKRVRGQEGKSQGQRATGQENKRPKGLDDYREKPSREARQRWARV